MAIPDDVAQLPGAGKATQLAGALEQGHTLTVFRQAKGESHPQDTAPDNAP